MLHQAAAILTCSVAIAVVGCGGEERPAEGDREVARAILDATVEVGRASTALFDCAEGDYECLGRAGSELAPRVDEELRRFEQALAGAANDCLRDGGEVFLRSLRAYKAAAIAAQAGDEFSLDEALDRAVELQQESQTKLSSCGLDSGGGSTGEMLREMQRAFASVQDPATALSNCQNFECVSREGARLEDSIDAALDRLTPAVEAAENECVRESGELALAALRAYGDVAVAAQEGDEQAAVDAGDRGYDLELRAVERLRGCSTGE